MNAIPVMQRKWMAAIIVLSVSPGAWNDRLPYLLGVCFCLQYLIDVGIDKCDYSWCNDARLSDSDYCDSRKPLLLAAMLPWKQN